MPKWMFLSNFTHPPLPIIPVIIHRSLSISPILNGPAPNRFLLLGYHGLLGTDSRGRSAAFASEGVTAVSGVCAIAADSRPK